MELKQSLRKADSANNGSMTAPNTNRSDHSHIINALVQRCRTQQSAELQTSDHEQHSSQQLEQIETLQNRFEDSVLELSESAQSNNLFQAISKVLKKHEQQIITSTYAKFSKGLSSKANQLSSAAELTEELSNALIKITQQRVGSMIQYACVNQKPGYDELEMENLIEYMVLSETNIRSEVEKKRLIYVSNYLFDRYEDHKTKLRELLENMEKMKSQAQTEGRKKQNSKTLERMKNVINELKENDAKNRETLEQLRLQQMQRKERLEQSNHTIRNLEETIQQMKIQVQQQMEAKDSELQFLRQSLGLLNTESKHLKDQLVLYSRQILDLKEQLQHQKQQKAKLSEINKQILEKYLEKVSNSAPNTQLQKHKNELFTLQRQNTVLNRQILDLTVNCENLKKKLTEKADEQTQKITKQNTEMLVRNVMHKTRIENLENQKACLLSELEKERDIVRKHEQTVHRIEQSVEVRAALLTKDIAQLKKERIHNIDTIDLLQRSLAQRESQQMQLQEQIRQFNQQLCQMHSNRDNYLKQSKEKVKQIANLSAQLHSLQQQLQHAHINKNQIATSFRQESLYLKDQITSQEKNTKSLLLMADSYKMRLEMVDQQNTLLKNQIKSLNQQITCLKETNQELTIKIHQHENEYEQVSEQTQKQYIQTKEQFNKLKRLHSELQNELEQQKQENKKYRQKLHQIEKQLDNAQVKLMKIDSLQNALVKTQQYAQELYNRLEQKEKLVKEISCSKQGTVEGSLISVQQFDAEYIEKKVVVNFLLNFLNQETPVSNRLNAIITMAEALKMATNDTNNIVASSQKWFTHQIIRKQKQSQQQTIQSQTIYQKFYQFLNDSD